MDSESTVKFYQQFLDWSVLDQQSIDQINNGFLTGSFVD